MARHRKVSLSPRKRPEQDRSRATVEAILEAAARVLVTSGYEAFTTNRVAEKAGISIGSFYQYFPNKDALLSELMRSHIEEIESGVVEMAVHAATMPLEQLIRVAIEQNINAHLINPELHRVLSEEVPLAGLTNWKATYTRRMHERVRAAFELRRSEIRVPDLDLAVYMVTSAVEAVVHNAVSARTAELKSGALAAELARMLVGYLTGKATLPQRAEKTAAE
jgi:AcrR family transcriptional regulator